jgi:endoglucanase
MKSTSRISRRTFLGRTALGGGALAVAANVAPRIYGEEARALPEARPERLPRWRGFNLLEKFNGRNDPFVERDFAWMAEWGFNFVRLPMDYRGWVEPDDWTKFREATFEEIDEAVGFGEKHGIHVQLNFHRAPGYTVANPPEEKPLWTNEEAQQVCALHWAQFARRYRGISNRRVSFNLLNEPATVTPELHRNAIEQLVAAIRAEDPERLIICDGRNYGKALPEELLDLKLGYATRGYEPFRLTHYKASWVQGADRWEEPGYPTVQGNTTWDKELLRERAIAPWKNFENQGAGVMVGEFGAYNKTPHPVVLNWMRDVLALWKEANWGWALWNFRGSFGILNSGRADVEYEDWRGGKLDRAMLELLRAG